ncbi:MAG: PKD domain-containing protein, partial [Patescibacteria group bacterium]
GTKSATLVISSGSEHVTRNCSIFVREQTQSGLSGSCFANPSSVRPNETITWNASASGGSGGYSYSWSGDVSGSSQNINRTYSQIGTKYGSVTITSGGQTIQRNCQAEVYEPSLNVSCGVNSSTYQIGNNVNWYSNISGGSGSYNYSWSGTDGLSGNSSSINRSYSSVGIKTATIYVTSGNQSAQATCQTNISTTIINEPSLNISCSANPNLSQINQSVYWNANAYGGTGNYTYYWSGTDGLSGNGGSAQRAYSSVGIKMATVTVNSGNQTASATCNTVVASQYTYSTPVSLTSYPIPGPGTFSSVYLDQIPYTGVVSNMNKATSMFLLLFWSASLAFVALQFARRKRELAMAGIDTTGRETPWTVLKNTMIPGAVESPYQEETEGVDDATEELENGDDVAEMSEQDEFGNADLEALSKLAITKKALVSKQALQKIYNREEGNFENASMELLKTIDRSVLVYPREDGWVILNSERLDAVENQTIS